MATGPEFRDTLAQRVITWGMAVTAAMAITAIVAVVRGDEKTGALAKDILTLVLPVVGTWIGSVLAFYFARENFEAAARETRLSLGQKLGRPASSAGIPIDKIKYLGLRAGEGAEAVKLADIRAHFDKYSNYYRVPILADTKAVRWVVHRQPLDGFFAEEGTKTEGKIAEPTLKDLLESKHGKQIDRGFVVLAENATLAEAKAAMEARPGCQDVFLTRNGRADEPITAWLTNNEIQRNAQG